MIGRRIDKLLRGADKAMRRRSDLAAPAAPAATPAAPAAPADQGVRAAVMPPTPPQAGRPGQAGLRGLSRGLGGLFKRKRTPQPVVQAESSGGGDASGFKKGGVTRADGCAKRGKTKGRYI